MTIANSLLFIVDWKMRGVLILPIPNLYLTWHAPELHSREWVLWQLAETAIGGDLAGRLWKLRQIEGLAYSVGTVSDINPELPLTSIYMATAGDKREAALKAIIREVKSARLGLKQSELDRVKVSYLARLNRLDRTAARRSQRHANWWVNGFSADHRTQIKEIIGSASLDEVNQVVQNVLDPERYVFVEAGAVGK